MRKARGGSQSGGTRRGRGRRGSRLTVRQRFLQQQQAEEHPEPHGGSGRDAGLRRDRSGDGGGRRPRGASAGGGGGEESAGAPCPGLRAWEAAQGPLLPPLALPRWGGGDRCAHRRALWRQLAAGRPCLSRHLLPRFTARMVKPLQPLGSSLNLFLCGQGSVCLSAASRLRTVTGSPWPSLVQHTHQKSMFRPGTELTASPTIPTSETPVEVYCLN